MFSRVVFFLLFFTVFLSEAQIFFPFSFWKEVCIPSTVTYTTNGVFTIPKGCLKLTIKAWGGGGGGGASNNAGTGGGGACICNSSCDSTAAGAGVTPGNAAEANGRSIGVQLLMTQLEPAAMARLYLFTNDLNTRK